MTEAFSIVGVARLAIGGLVGTCPVSTEHRKTQRMPIGNRKLSSARLDVAGRTVWIDPAGDDTLTAD